MRPELGPTILGGQPRGPEIDALSNLRIPPYFGAPVVFTGVVDVAADAGEVDVVVVTAGAVVVSFEPQDMRSKERTRMTADVIR